MAVKVAGRCRVHADAVELIIHGVPLAEVARALPATAEELRLLEQIDGKRNAREVCERAGTDSFNGARFLLALTYLGLLHLVTGYAPAPSSRSPSEPVDLSFLDEITPSAKPAQAPPPSAAKSAPAGAAFKWRYVP